MLNDGAGGSRDGQGRWSHPSTAEACATEPAADSTVTTTPQAVVLTSTASILGGEVTVSGPDGAPVGAGPVAHDGAALTAPVAHMPPTSAPPSAAVSDAAEPTPAGDATTATDPGTGTDAASAESAGGLPGWVPAVAVAVAVVVAAALALRRRPRR
ncbi:hypothetical protein [Geodermatophilus bullaregiensis]|uniref:hypothetical protein n=1 Tax=Geodermatophilus bullaregiensis TaxID=1564160 RepID=UPI001959CF1C|nr:hypothetical protein [Geodermatophilus bullaregiensis]